MMLNEIIGMSNSSDILSGVGKTQALKDGSFVDLCQITDSAETQQKNFLAILSQLGTGIIQLRSEESKNVNLKLDEGQLPDEVKADNVSSGKPKEKKDKDGCVVKRLLSGFPGTLGFATGLPSIEEPPQLDLSADPAFHALGAVNEARFAVDPTAGELSPETVADKGLSMEHNFKAGNFSMVPVLSDSDSDSAVPVEIVPNIQVKGKIDVEMVSKADPPGMGRVRAVPIKQLSEDTGTQPERALTLQPSLTSESIPFEAEQAQALAAKGSRIFLERWRRLDVETGSVADRSDIGRVQGAPVEEIPKLQGQLQHGPLSLSDKVNQYPLAENHNSDVKENPTQRVSVNNMSMDSAVREKVPTDQKNSPDKSQVVKLGSSLLFPANESDIISVIAATSGLTSIVDGNETPHMFLASDNTGRIAGGEDSSRIQSSEQAPELEIADVAVISARETQTENISRVNPSSKESQSEVQTVHPEMLKQTRVAFKVSQIFQGNRQRDVGEVLEAGFSDTIRFRVAPAVEAPMSQVQRQRDPVSFPDEFNQKSLEGEHNPGVKSEQTQRFSADKSNDEAAREKVTTDPKDALDRPQAVQVKSTSFFSAKGSVEPDGISVSSAGTSKTGDNETPNMSLPANKSGSNADREDKAHFQVQEPEFGGPAVHFARENQTENTSWVNPSSNGPRTEDPSFQSEVMKQIAEKVSTNLKSSKSEIQIDLKPESLGHLRLHISTDQQQVSVKILAENTLVKEMIESQATLIRNELQQQGIHVNTVTVDMLMSGGTDIAYSNHKGTAFKQARHEPAYGGGKDNVGDNASKEPDSLDQANNRGGSLVNYFA
jgi:flagellar hook-length control protein FliK